MNFIIWGTGGLGMELFHHLKEKVAFFCDNNKNMHGKQIEGVEVISYERLMNLHKKYVIILAMNTDAQVQVRLQLEQSGINDYVLYEADWRKVRKEIKKVKEKEYPINIFLDEMREKSCRIDFLNGFYEFKDIVSECKARSKGEKLFYVGKVESEWYGYGKAIMEYAGIEEDYVNFPIVTHGADYVYPGDLYSRIFKRDTATIVFGNLYKKKHNRARPYVPIFALGPYIRYARMICTDSHIEELKKSNGKTAVIFICHSIEGSRVKYDEKKLIRKILDDDVNKYDTVIACAYWNDIDKSIYEILHNNGVKVVSAGFRWDSMFVRRLKTIISLADDVIFYGLTTAVVFAMSMNKNVVIRDVNEERGVESCCKLFSEVTYTSDKVDKWSDSPFFEDSEGNICWNIDDVKNMFGLDIYRSPQEITSIYNVCCDIWNNCNHEIREYPIGVYRTYLDYQRRYEFEKLTILSQAMGQEAIIL